MAREMIGTDLTGQDTCTQDMLGFCDVRGRTTTSLWDVNAIIVVRQVEVNVIRLPGSRAMLVGTRVAPRKALRVHVQVLRNATLP